MEKDKFKIVSAESFEYYDEDDDFLYHVTSQPNAERIESKGINLSAEAMFGKSYQSHSEDRLFLTEKSGVMFWKSRVEDQLFDKFDDPPEVAVVHIPKSVFKNVLQKDEIGSSDAKHPAWFIARDDMPDYLLMAAPARKKGIRP